MAPDGATQVKPAWACALEGVTMSLEVPDPRTDAEQALCDHGLTEGGGPSGDR
jgi:hypothetical protein